MCRHRPGTPTFARCLPWHSPELRPMTAVGHVAITAYRHGQPTKRQDQFCHLVQLSLTVKHVFPGLIDERVVLRLDKWHFNFPELPLPCIFPKKETPQISTLSTPQAVQKSASTRLSLCSPLSQLLLMCVYNQRGTGDGKEEADAASFTYKTTRLWATLLQYTNLMYMHLYK